MHVKRIYRPSVREALLAAREQLGPGALVLSTELVPALGWRGWLGQRIVRLTAAAERPSVDAGDAPPLSADRPSLAARRQAPIDQAREGAIARLVSIGMDRAFAQAVVGRLDAAECRGASEDALRRALATELESIAAGNTPYARCEIFVGPPGVGKTTTIAKIAAQERVAGGQPLSLIVTDTLRAGAIEQLRAYAAVLRLPLRVARTPDELSAALTAARQPTLIDTAGRPPSDRNISEVFDVLARKRSVRTHLVLAADTSAAVARRLLERYAPLKPSRVVITKLDEAESVVPLLGTVRAHGLPVSYLTAGQRVPEDLQRATSAGLAAALLREPAQEELTCH